MAYEFFPLPVPVQLFSSRKLLFSALFRAFLAFQWRPMTQSIGYHEVAKFRGFSFSYFKWKKKNVFHLLNSSFIHVNGF